MLRVENNLNKMANLKFALNYFDVSGFLEVVYRHLGEFYFLAISFSLGEAYRQKVKLLWMCLNHLQESRDIKKMHCELEVSHFIQIILTLLNIISRIVNLSFSREHFRICAGIYSLGIVFLVPMWLWKMSDSASNWCNYLVFLIM